MMTEYIDKEALMKALEKEVESADDWKTAHEIVNVVKYFPATDDFKYEYDAGFDDGYRCGYADRGAERGNNYD